MRESEGQVFYHFLLWEDWNLGMYEPRCNPDIAAAAAKVLGVTAQFSEWSRKVLTEMPHSAAHNLSALHHNPRPWIGRAACLLAVGASQTETTYAWLTLTPRQQATANTIADHRALQWRTSEMKGQASWTW